MSIEQFESSESIKESQVPLHDQDSREIGVGTAHSKIILMGEHAVVYDYPAIALPFPAVKVKTTARHSNRDYI